LSFPYHDPNWVTVADWMRPRARPGDRILAPDIFWWRFPKIHRYRDPFLRPQAEYDWAILHKGELDRLPQAFLARLVKTLHPVFANDVFVVLARNAKDALHRKSPHVKPLFIAVDALARRGERPPPSFADDDILPDPGSISQFTSLSDEEIASAMDAFWTHGGYEFVTERDKLYSRDVERHIAAFIGDAAQGARVLDVCCGMFRTGKFASDDIHVVGIDVSRVAIDRARAAHGGHRNVRLEAMDAHRLAFPDASFDRALLLDAAEHLRDPQRVLAEIFRVLKPGGRLLASFANRDSVNQVLTRKLGYPEFVTNYQHFREFSFTEAAGLLKDAGFATISTAGLLLYPYWGVPGIDGVVRHITDDDPEFAELMRLLGERVGAEHAYTSVFVVSRPAGG